MKEKIKSFTDLIVWQKGHIFVSNIYRATRLFPKEEQFGLTSQLRRTTVGITSAIAEGFSMCTYKDKLYFLYHCSWVAYRNSKSVANCA